MANAMLADFADRGLIIVHFVIDDGTGDGVVDWQDAHRWAYSGAYFPVLDPRIVVLADPDGSSWNRFSQSCADLTGIPYTDCTDTCPYTPQAQVIDQGGVTVSDTCARPPGSSECTQCGYSDSYYRTVLDSILPAAWCGEAIP